jgi:hypothetical protein
MKKLLLIASCLLCVNTFAAPTTNITFINKSSHPMTVVYAVCTGNTTRECVENQIQLGASINPTDKNYETIPLDSTIIYAAVKHATTFNGGIISAESNYWFKESNRGDCAAFTGVMASYDRNTPRVAFVLEEQSAMHVITCGTSGY